FLQCVSLEKYFRCRLGRITLLRQPSASKIHSLIFTSQGQMFLPIGTAARYYSRNRVASAQFFSYVTIARPAATASAFRPSFVTPREKLRLGNELQAASPARCLMGWKEGTAKLPHLSPMSTQLLLAHLGRECIRKTCFQFDPG